MYAGITMFFKYHSPYGCNTIYLLCNQFLVLGTHTHIERMGHDYGIIPRPLIRNFSNEFGRLPHLPP